MEDSRASQCWHCSPLPLDADDDLVLVESLFGIKQLIKHNDAGCAVLFKPVGLFSQVADAALSLGL